MEQNIVVNAQTRYNHLARYDTADNICRKMNAEFHATFYRGKGAVWMRCTDEQGKSHLRKLNGSY